MTNQQHPITPPPELIQQWVDSWYDAKVKHDELATFITTQAAGWGADQELEACLAEVSFFNTRSLADKIRITRRPKPPSLKEQALVALRTIETNVPQSLRAFEDSCEHIRRALEALPDD